MNKTTLKAMNILLVSIIIGSILNQLVVYLLPVIKSNIITDGIVSIIIICIVYQIIAHFFLKKDAINISDKINTKLGLISIVSGIIIFQLLTLEQVGILNILEKSPSIYVLSQVVIIAIIYNFAQYFSNKKEINK